MASGLPRYARRSAQVRQQKLEEAARRFPSITRLDWVRLLKADDQTFADIISDILKVDQAQDLKQAGCAQLGKRANVAPSEARARFARLLGDKRPTRRNGQPTTPADSATL